MLRTIEAAGTETAIGGHIRGIRTVAAGSRGRYYSTLGPRFMINLPRGSQLLEGSKSPPIANRKPFAKQQSTMGRLQGKVAIVTGAGSGFGEAIAKAYAREGANVIIADIGVEGGKRVEKEIESAKKEGTGSAVFIEFDCTQKEAWEKALQLAKDKFGKLDLVINNAGTTYHKKPSTEVTEAEFDKIVNVNVKSIYQSVIVVMPYFQQRKSGQYINTSSVAGTRVRPGMVWYGGTKGFVNTVWISAFGLRAIV
jgi:NADP-dependent 3-hydroxy acid dehydrogenase YdfG